MYGAIIGDVAGSYYEILEARARKNKQIRSYMEKTMILDKNIPLFTEKSSCTDDSILTIAIMDAKLNNKDYKETLKEYGLRELELGKDIYNRGRFGKGFVKWLTGDYEGDSYGNGCAMRISSIGFLCNSLEEVKEESYKATIPSHNHEESIKCAEAVAVSIFLLRNGLPKEKLKEYIENNYFKLDYNLDDLRLNYLFTSRAIDSVPQAIYCFLESKDFENAITDKTRAIIINSPSNPTGSVYSEEELRAIAEVAVKHNIYIISDEVYEHLVYDGAKHISIASFGEDIKKLTIVVNAMSKTYAMTGWRIGYTACEKELATAMANIQSHATSNPNSFAQAASCVALDGSLDCVNMMKEEFKKRRDYMYERINSIEGVSCIKPNGAFYIMMNIDKIIGRTLYGKKINGSDDFAELFLEKALVAIVPCSGFGADNYLRWSYATSMESIRKGLDRLEKFIMDGIDK